MPNGLNQGNGNEQIEVYSKTTNQYMWIPADELMQYKQQGWVATGNTNP